jgi:hypothetical protein
LKRVSSAQFVYFFQQISHQRGQFRPGFKLALQHGDLSPPFSTLAPCYAEGLMF